MCCLRCLCFSLFVLFLAWPTDCRFGAQICWIEKHWTELECNNYCYFFVYLATGPFSCKLNWNETALIIYIQDNDHFTNFTLKITLFMTLFLGVTFMPLSTCSFVACICVLSLCSHVILVIGLVGLVTACK